MLKKYNLRTGSKAFLLINGIKKQSNHRRKNFSFPFYEIVVLAASTGDVEALSRILSHLPDDFPVPLIIGQNRTAHLPWFLDSILGSETRLKVKYAVKDEAFKPGTVYIVPTDERFIAATKRRVALNSHRKFRQARTPVNTLFAAAEVFKNMVIAVVLNGSAADSSREVNAIKKANGIVIWQGKTTSDHLKTQGSGINNGLVDYVLPVEKIADAISGLVRTGRY